ncbi:MAG: hypothetical protein AAF542_19610 [Pseudomonadota bacterium]
MLNNKILNRWWLFCLISAPMSLLILLEMLSTGLLTGEDVSHMIGYAVRWAIPFIFLVIATSSLLILFPNAVTKWLMRNRKYLGLCFAVAMAWQGLFILIVSTVHREYYFSDIFYFRDELEGTVGYLFLAAMTITSFQFARKRITPAQWKVIHTCGVYFLWAYPFSVYWWNLFYYPNLEPFASPRTWDYILYAAGFFAVAVRIAAWGKQRLAAAGPTGVASPALSVFGGLLIVFGLLAAVSGAHWLYIISDLMAGTGHLAELELWLPFWPLEPFLPLLIIGLGTMCLSHRNPAMQSA